MGHRSVSHPRRRRGDGSTCNESAMPMSSVRFRSVAMVAMMCCLACRTPPCSSAWLVAYAYASPAHPLLPSSSVSRRSEARGGFSPRGAFGPLFCRGGGEAAFDAPAMPRYELPVIRPADDEEDDENDLSALAMDGEALGEEGDNEA